LLKHIGSKKVLGQTLARTSRPAVAPFPKRDPGRAQRAGLRRPRSQTCGVIFRMCIFPGMIVGRRVADTSILRPLSEPWRALATTVGWRSRPSDAPCPAGRGDASLARFLHDADAGLSRGLQVHSQWLGQSL